MSYRGSSVRAAVSPVRGNICIYIYICMYMGRNINNDDDMFEYIIIIVYLFFVYGDVSLTRGGRRRSSVWFQVVYTLIPLVKKAS